MQVSSAHLNLNSQPNQDFNQTPKVHSTSNSSFNSQRTPEQRLGVKVDQDTDWPQTRNEIGNGFIIRLHCFDLNFHFKILLQEVGETKAQRARPRAWL